MCSPVVHALVGNVVEAISNNYAAIVTALVVIAATSAYLKYLYHERLKKMPPTMSISLKSFIENFSTGNGHRLHLKLSLESPVCRLPIMSMTSIFLIADPTLAKTIMEGDSESDTPESDKSTRYKTMAKFTGGVGTILTKLTNDKSREVARKAVAHSFSQTNLYKLLPQMDAKLNEFIEVLDDHILKVLRQYPWMKFYQNDRQCQRLMLIASLC